MTGGLLQLASYGVKDLYLSGNPKFTLFKTSYKRHTNFASETMKLPITGTINFNNVLTCKIPEQGDLITKMYLKITISGTSGSNGKWAFAKNIGHVIIDHISFLVNGVTIDKQYGHWINIWNEMFRNPEHDRGYNIMTGNTSSATTLSSADKSVTLYVPLKFFFNRFNGLALPMIALKNSSVRLDIKLSKSKYCYIKESQYYTGSAFSNTSVTLSLSTPELYLNYIFLDSDERKRFAKYRHEYLIEQVQRSGSATILANSTSYDYNLIFNHPCKAVFWTIQRNNLVNGTKYLSQDDLTTATKRLVLAYSDFTSAYAVGEYLTPLSGASSALQTLINNTYASSAISSESAVTLSSITCDKLLTASQFSDEDWVSTLGGSAVRNTGTTNPGNVAFDVAMYQKTNYGLYNNYTGHTFTNAVIKLQGQNRFTKQSAKYFNYAQNYEVGNSTPNEGIYMYSFSLYPFKHQPSGTCNFTKLDSATLSLDLPASMPKSTIVAFATNYNVFKIMEGIGSLSYAN